MFLPVLGIVIALAVGSPGTLDDASTGELPSPGVPQVRWLPSQIAVVEPSTSSPSGHVVAWKIVYDPSTHPMLLVPGMDHRSVAQLQRHLTRLGVFRGEVDGVYGREVAAAVVAVKKLAGLDRTDVWAPDDWKIELDHSAILQRHDDELDRIEIDLNRQVMFVIRAGSVAAVVPVSSGNGELYWSKNGGPGGGIVKATTPKGDFKLFKHIDGWRKNYLGNLYKPWYFTPYYAVHGSSSVPAHPASHGCVRVPLWEADHLDSLFELGLSVHIWDEPFEPAEA